MILDFLFNWLMTFVIQVLSSTVCGVFFLILFIVLVLDSIINFLFKEVRL